ncbi:glycosyltransferase involved in cell wall biosynthesis [Filimonas zeae]|uniref:Glycosyl transferase family 1 domain-containing protein n=1 Tax=Filimonas zeae TaxID=1737353 RepID=A0A917IL55_9BACT|nr:glycosyltransferase family 4 protein [Filimonas zeae]MDR6337002.1 glycosyltransferase involved in cell wall biosynthesis [Filimonas zeae]GGH56534.1 hypothetical protein GCM10011379_00230 [Filimonas zeae]
MQKVLLSAFACDPSKGSEPGNGWNWSSGLAKRGFEVHCLTRVTGKTAIEERNSGREGRLFFHYVMLPLGMEKLYGKGAVGMYLYYLLWQWAAYRKAQTLKKAHAFKVAHHVTWGSLQMGSFLYRLGIPFIFGPSGGGQKAPVTFKKYFLNYWGSEEKREKVSDLMVKYNPGFKGMLKKAHTVLVSNEETLEMARAYGGNKVEQTLDAALPDDFFPDIFVPKKTEAGLLKLLWVGRFMPRKGLLLLLDVMKELKHMPGITLTVVGDGEMKDAFLQKQDEYGLSNTVDWKGKVPFDVVREYYASHDAFFFTSLRDSCPAQLIEAMAFGLPVITLNLHGQALIVNDENGIKCSCETPEEAIKELKAAILSLYNNSERVQTMSTAAHNFARQQNWNKKIDHIIQHYYPV